MASNSLEEGKISTRTLNIPKIAIRCFIEFADGNSVNETLGQSLCYLFGLRQKKNEDEVWIDTIVIPKQASLMTSVEDNGI